MLPVNRKAALAAVAAAAALMSAILASAPRGGLQSAGGAASAMDPQPCVAAVLPDTYYQAIAELNACTGAGVAVETAPLDIPWAVGQVPVWPDSRVIVDP